MVGVKLRVVKLVFAKLTKFNTGKITKDISKIAKKEASQLKTISETIALN